MSEPVQLAKSARTQLATALNALQSSDAMPPELEDLAELIAEAMGILHRIERSSGQHLEGRDVVLVRVRECLNRIQALTVDHPVIDEIMEAVAMSLSKVHALARLDATSVAPLAAAPPAAAPPAAAQPAPVLRVAEPVPAPRPAAPGAQHARQQAIPPIDVERGSPAWSSSFAPSQQAIPPIDVELGTWSASNFYQGLGGNDVLEHGGIFVATYRVAKIGSTVRLRVYLPGDYEFHASAQVRWTREPGGAGDSTEPGFGARFTQISQEGRQLVSRYTRNREPLFYDDP